MNRTYCFDCKHFCPDRTGASSETLTEKDWDEVMRGECRRYPPHVGKYLGEDVLANGYDYGQWPLVLASDWCSAFQPCERALAADAKRTAAALPRAYRSSPKLRHGKAEFVPGNNTIRLHIYSGGKFREVDLNEFEDPRSALEWILHLHGSAWIDSQTLWDFLNCLNDACWIMHGENATGVLVHDYRRSVAQRPSAAPAAVPKGPRT